MPVRSLSSSVLKWPDAGVVKAAVRAWSADLLRNRPEVVRVGFFGSYARGEWGVGSDVDLLVIVSEATGDFARRGIRYDATALPVPADVLVYTTEEWTRVSREGMARAAREVVWAPAVEHGFA